MNGFNHIKIHATKEVEMGYANICKGLWMFVSLQDGMKSQVGPHYATKAELLADADRYISSWRY